MMREQHGWRVGFVHDRDLRLSGLRHGQGDPVFGGAVSELERDGTVEVDTDSSLVHGPGLRKPPFRREVAATATCRPASVIIVPGAPT